MQHGKVFLLHTFFFLKYTEMAAWFKKKTALLNAEQQQQIVAAIKRAEATTSGEIRVYVESRCPHINAADRASEIFFKLKMNRTQHRNATLVYVALTDHQMAVFGDEGIDKKVGGYQFWENELMMMKSYFEKGWIADGISRCVIEIGESLSKYFPFERGTDKNELPDDIVFGS